VYIPSPAVLSSYRCRSATSSPSQTVLVWGRGVLGDRGAEVGLEPVVWWLPSEFRKSLAGLNRYVAEAQPKEIVFRTVNLLATA
jgi:hypothetical protein